MRPLPSIAKGVLMEYDVRKESDWVVVSVRGPLNFEHSDELRSAFDRIVSEGSRKVRLELKMVPVADSAGISSILILYRSLKKRKGTLEIKGVSQNLLEMFKLLKIDKLIKIVE
jgi:anti-anti-sigma factor